jgi:LemA protein
VSDEGARALWIGGGWLVALLLLWAWWRSVRFCRLLKDLPTVRIRGIFVGLVETTGRVTHGAPLRAGISATPCVHHSWSVSEHWRRLKTYRDSKGRTQTRWESGSDVVASGDGATDFTLVDDTASIGVRVKGADWRDRSTVSETVGRGHPLYHTKAPDVHVSGSTGLRTFSECVVAIDDKVFLVGAAAISSEGSALELLRDTSEDDLLIISTGSEKSVRGARMGWAIAAFVFGLLAAAAGGAGAWFLFAGWYEATARDNGPALATGGGAGALLFVTLALALWIAIMRNGVVRVRTRWQRAVSLVDVELRRRSDLIPNLVVVTQGLAVHERSVQEAMAKLRAGAAAGATMAALAEAYPKLKADGAFLRLQTELTTTEDRIALARGFEVESRATFLERLRTFPEGFVARVFGVAAPPPELGDPTRGV